MSHVTAPACYYYYYLSIVNLFAGLAPAPSVMSELPPNVRVSKHPCLRAKLSQLRSKSTNARETKELVHEISLILGTQALAGLDVVVDGAVRLHTAPREAC